MTDDMASEMDDLWHEADDHINYGRFYKAIEIYTYILVRYSDNNLANEYANAHLGEILLMLGKTDLAENHVRKALSYDPQNPHYHSQTWGHHSQVGKHVVVTQYYAEGLYGL